MNTNFDKESDYKTLGTVMAAQGDLLQAIAHFSKLAVGGPSTPTDALITTFGAYAAHKMVRLAQFLTAPHNLPWPPKYLSQIDPEKYAETFAEVRVEAFRDAHGAYAAFYIAWKARLKGMRRSKAKMPKDASSDRACLKASREALGIALKAFEEESRKDS